MIDNICKLPSYQHAAIIFGAQFAWLLLEAWLGKTDKTKSGSTLELVYNTFKAIFKRSQDQ